MQAEKKPWHLKTYGIVLKQQVMSSATYLKRDVQPHIPSQTSSYHIFELAYYKVIYRIFVVGQQSSQGIRPEVE